MSANEFALINDYFKVISGKGRNVVLGIGDDAAVTTVPPGYQLVTTVDTLVQSIHFDNQVKPQDLAHKAVAVNLSDLASMGAEPAWITLSLTIPDVDHQWLAAFSEGLALQCHYFDIELIGGDTCRGNTSITIQAMGFVPENMAIKRSNAQVGDLIYVTGTLGDAGAGLELNQQDRNDYSEDETYLLNRLHRPTPRVETGIHLRKLANAAIDISDGLVQDLQHILDASSVGAQIDMAKLPLSQQLNSTFNEKQARSFALTSGDDYELCFTIPVKLRQNLERTFATTNTAITQIGHIVSSKGLQIKNNTYKLDLEKHGYDHFQSTLQE